MFIPRRIHFRKPVMQKLFLVFACHFVSILAAEHLEDAQHFVRIVVVENEVFAESGPQARIGFDELVHEFRVAGYDNDQFVAVVFHSFENRFDRLLAVAILSICRQGVRFVDEQHAAKCALDHFLGFDGCLAKIPANQRAAVGLDQLAFRQDADLVIEARDEPRHGGLAGARIAGEHQVQGNRRPFHAALFTELNDLDEVDQAVDIIFNVLHADQFVQLIQKLLHGFFASFREFFLSFGLLWRLLGSFCNRNLCITGCCTAAVTGCRAAAVIDCGAFCQIQIEHLAQDFIRIEFRESLIAFHIAVVEPDAHVIFAVFLRAAVANIS